MRSLFVLCLNIYSLFLPAQWQQTTGPTGDRLYDIGATDAHVYAAGRSGLHISADGGYTWEKADFLPTNATVYCLLADGETVFLGVHIPDEPISQGNFLYQTTDDGISWQRTPMYYLTGTGSIFGRFYGSAQQLYYSLSSTVFKFEGIGQGWTVVDTPGGSQRADSDGTHLVSVTADATYLSSDAGSTWQLVDATGGGVVVPFVADSLIARKILGGPLKISTDLGATWASVTVPVAPHRILQGSDGALYILNEDIYRSADGGATWTMIFDGAFLMDPTGLVVRANGNYLVAASRGLVQTTPPVVSPTFGTDAGLIGPTVEKFHPVAGGGVLAETQIGLFISDSLAQHWRRVDLPFRYGFWHIVTHGDTIVLKTPDGVLLSTDKLITVDSIADSPSNLSSKFHYAGGRYYTGTSSIVVSTDLTTWVPYTIDLPAGSPSPGEIVNFVELGPDTLLVYTKGGYVHRSVDNGQIWVTVLSNIDHNNFDRLYAAGSSVYVAGREQWYRSEDGGLTWSSPGMLGMPLTNLSNPAWPTQLGITDGVLFASAREFGVYVSLDFGEHWQPFNSGLDGLAVYQAFCWGGQVYASVQNNGVYRHSADLLTSRGMVFRDDDGDGMQDPDELGYAGGLIASTSTGLYQPPLGDGYYGVLSTEAVDTLRFIPQSAYVQVEPTYHSVPNANGVYDFAITLLPNINDLQIVLTEVAPFRPGFGGSLNFTVNNLGSTDRIPVVEWRVPGGLFNVSSQLTPAFQSADSVSWTLAPLAPGASSQFTVHADLAATTALGTVIDLHTSVLPIADDEVQADNTDSLQATVVGAYDPNDKRVVPADRYTPGMHAAETPLVYTVRFQNTGTYYAERVELIDTLDVKLEPSSFRLLANSHAVDWTITDGRILRFVFDNIFLPDSTNNEPESHGFVKFSLLPVRELQLGDAIPNFADIYFDFNAPIRTNTAVSVYDQSTAIRPSAVRPAGPLRFQPNPAKQLTRWSVGEPVTGAGQLQVFDTQGKLVSAASVVARAGEGSLLTRGWVAGVYTVRLRVGERNWVGRLIVQ